MYSSVRFLHILAVCGHAFAQSRTPTATSLSSSVASTSLSQSAVTTATTSSTFQGSDPGAPPWAAGGYGPPAWIASAASQYQESLRLHGQNATLPSNSTETPFTSSGPATASITGNVSSTAPPATTPANHPSPVYKTVAIVLGVTLFTVIVALIAYWILQRRRAKQRKDTWSNGDSRSGHSPSTLRHHSAGEQPFEVECPMRGRGQPELWDTQRVEMRGTSWPIRNELPT